MFKGIIRIIISYTLILFSLLLGISLIGFSFNDLAWYSTNTNINPVNWLGTFGIQTALPFFVMYGFGAWVWSVASFYTGIVLLFGIAPSDLIKKILMFHYLAFMTAAAASLKTASFEVGGIFGALTMSWLSGFIPFIVNVFLVTCLWLLGIAGFFPNHVASMIDQIKKSIPKPHSFDPVPVMAEDYGHEELLDDSFSEQPEYDEDLGRRNLLLRENEETVSGPFDVQHEPLESPYNNFVATPEFLRNPSESEKNDITFLTKKRPNDFYSEPKILRDVDFDLLSPYYQTSNSFYKKMQQIELENNPQHLETENTIAVMELDQSENLLSQSETVRLSFDKGGMDESDNSESSVNSEGNQESIAQDNIADMEKLQNEKAILDNKETSTENLELVSEQHITTFPPKTYTDSHVELLNLDHNISQIYQQPVLLDDTTLTDSEKLLIQGIERTQERQNSKSDALKQKFSDKHDALAKEFHKAYPLARHELHLELKDTFSQFKETPHPAFFQGAPQKSAVVETISFNPIQTEQKNTLIQVMDDYVEEITPKFMAIDKEFAQKYLGDELLELRKSTVTQAYMPDDHMVSDLDWSAPVSPESLKDDSAALVTEENIIIPQTNFSSEKDSLEEFMIMPPLESENQSDSDIPVMQSFDDQTFSVSEFSNQQNYQNSDVVQHQNDLESIVTDQDQFNEIDPDQQIPNLDINDFRPLPSMNLYNEDDLLKQQSVSEPQTKVDIEFQGDSIVIVNGKVYTKRESENSFDTEQNSTESMAYQPQEESSVVPNSETENDISHEHLALEDRMSVDFEDQQAELAPYHEQDPIQQGKINVVENDMINENEASVHEIIADTPKELYSFSEDKIFGEDNTDAINDVYNDDISLKNLDLTIDLTPLEGLIDPHSDIPVVTAELEEIYQILSDNQMLESSETSVKELKSLVDCSDIDDDTEESVSLQDDVSKFEQEEGSIEILPDSEDFVMEEAFSQTGKNSTPVSEFIIDEASDLISDVPDQENNYERYMPKEAHEEISTFEETDESEVLDNVVDDFTIITNDELIFEEFSQTEPELDRKVKDTTSLEFEHEEFVKIPDTQNNNDTQDFSYDVISQFEDELSNKNVIEILPESTEISSEVQEDDIALSLDEHNIVDGLTNLEKEKNQEADDAVENILDTDAYQSIAELDSSEADLMPKFVTHAHLIEPTNYPVNEQADSDFADKEEANSSEELVNGLLDEYQKSVKEYKFPPVEILDPNTDHISKEQEDQEIEDTMKMIEDTYESFNINMQVVDFSRGPTITRFEMEPPSGLKLRTIFNLQDDLALQAGTSNIRIISPVEGRSYIGIEVPNKIRRQYLLREQVESVLFQESKAELPLILGLDVGGKEIVSDLATTPHLLIAGTTGSGKSVYVNALILGMLYKLPPEDLRFIMIDPKMVELELYSGIPHLLAPIITKPEEAMAALEWAVEEMDRRYKILSELSVRNIKEYNNLRETETGLEKLPYIVIIVDEFANLMLRAPKDTERYISRLASMSRAVGMHLVLATQRPSVDVVTGVIKANFPSRIAFRVSSKIDSRTILDKNGAETLLGRGDMLFMSPQHMDTVRIQSPFASSEDAARVVHALKKNGSPEYVVNFSDLLEKEEEKSSDGSRTDALTDPLFEEVLRFAVDNGEISASGIQRRFRVGYNRASRLIESMKDLKIISPPPSAGKGWQINITRDQVEEFLN